MGAVSERIAARQLHLVVHLMVNPDDKAAHLVGIGAGNGLCKPAGGHCRVSRSGRAGNNPACAIRTRVILQQVQACRIEGQPTRVDSGTREVRQGQGQIALRGDGQIIRLQGLVPLPFIREEEEGAVLHDRPGYRASVIVIVIGERACGEVVLGVQPVVVSEIEA